MSRTRVLLAFCAQAGVLGLRNIPKSDVGAETGILSGRPWGAQVNAHTCNDFVDSGFFPDAVDPGFPPLKMCKDGWDSLLQSHAGKPCVAYDIGVRDVADFALAMAQNLNCSVRAYDPSPTTKLWWDEGKFSDGTPALPADKVMLDRKRLKELEKKGVYTLEKVAASGHDGELKLYAYNWAQISTFRATQDTQDKQKEFVVPSKTLETMMKDHGDDFIDVLKIDIEGSEFPFMTDIFDKGCPPVEHFFLEWHSQSMDKAYGAPPEVQELEKKMAQCGYKMYTRYPFFPTHVTPEEKFDIHLTYFGHAGYCKSCVK